MDEILNWINLFISTLGITAASYLFLSGKDNPYLSKLLAVPILAMSIRNFTLSLLNNELVDFSVFPVYLFSGFQFIAPASIYLYHKALINDETHWDKKYIIHFIPGIIVFILTIITPIFYQQSPIQYQTTHIYDHSIQNLKMIVDAKYLYIAWLVLAFPYLIGTYRVFIRGVWQGRFTGIHGKEIGIWVLIQIIPMTLFFSYLGKEIITSLFNNTPVITHFNHLVAKNLYVLMMFIYVVLKPQLLIGLPKLRNTDKLISEPEILAENFSKFPVLLEIAGWNDPSKESNPVYDRSNLPKLMMQLQSYLLTDKEFNKSDYSIEELSLKTQIPLHHIRFVFRYYNDWGFNGYKNFIRLTRMIELFKLQKHELHTIESLGEMAGFGSHSTMLRCFRKHLGMSPIEIIQLIQAADVNSHTNNNRLINICKLIPVA